MPTLYIFSGLPAAGKSTLALELARRLRAVYLRIDTIERTLKETSEMEVKSEGYEVAYRVAADNLQIGLSIVADSCNAIVITRCSWEKVATAAGAQFINIQVVCSDKAEHRRRLETRTSTVPGLAPATWKEVENREYHAWAGDRVIIETAGRTGQESVADLYRALGLP